MSVASPRLLKTSTRHGDAILRRLPEGPVCGVEVGVCRGVLSDYLMSHHRGLDLLMVDWWGVVPQGDAAYQWSQRHGEPCNVQTDEQVEDNLLAATRVVNRHGRGTILRAPSLEAAREVDDASRDFVFLDADHRYQSVVEDIAAWLPKVKPGGWIGGHDYLTPGIGSEVAQAVDEFVAASGLTLETDTFYTWFTRLPAGGGA